MSDQEWRRIRRFVAWGIFGLILLVGVSIIASLLFFGTRTSGTFYSFFPGFFPFHFGWLGGIFIILVFFLIARWIFSPWRNGNSSTSYSQKSDNGAQYILKERYAKGEITKEQFEQMLLDLKRTD
jgi:putative membrane protein